MKQVLFVLLFLGGAVLSTQAQGRRGYDRDYRGRGYDRHYSRRDNCNRVYYRERYVRPYYRPRPVVPVVAAPVVYAPVPVPAPCPLPPPVPVYTRGPRVVISTGPIVIGL